MAGSRKFAILTCGGDCPGLNAVIRGAAKTLLNEDCKVYGVMNGFNGLINENIVELNHSDLVNIVSRGGTILGSSNRDNPFKFARHVGDEVVFEDRHENVIKNMKKYDIEALILIGGDGTMNIGKELADKCGIKIVACPKTIDNDVACTERTFGFDTAVDIATQSLDRLLTTAESHHRVMILEVMGRNSGWIAMQSGIAGTANVILVPEIPYKFESVVATIKERQSLGKRHSLIVVAEGAKPVGGDVTIARLVKDSVEPVRLGGVG
ncbi:MAG TPA: 6-phosphofructokinase, partial [Sutterella sp.]|nr:6-phosphofructokinase [Sutterella sp.]